MRYLVISDTHGRIETAVQIWGKHSKEAPLDGILHLGDLTEDAVRISHRLNVPVTAVSGNMDGGSDIPDHRIWASPYGPVLLTHGHRQSVKSGLSNLLYRTLELECKAAIFGHTHIPCLEFADGVHLLNPGSLTRPLGGRPSYALLTLEKGVFRASILFWDPAPTVRGGKLYDMLNQSDRA